jgi:hypothetical protein
MECDTYGPTAFGVVLLVSLYRELRRNEFLDEAERVVAEVERVLGRPRGLRIGEAAQIQQAYSIVVTISDKNEVQAFKITVNGGPLFTKIKEDGRSVVDPQA